MTPLQPAAPAPVPPAPAPGVAPPPAPGVASAPRLLTRGDRWTMVGRLFLLQALWNYERMQGIGFAYALAPAVRRVEGDDAKAARALVPHLGYFNTHPVMAAVAVGVTADQVERRARGEEAFDAAGLTRVQQALGASLAAMGDPLFWNAVRPLVALAAVFAWREGQSVLSALVLLAGYNAIAVGYRARGLFTGYARGLPYVAQLPARLMQLTRTLRLLAGILSALLVAAVLVPPGGLSVHPTGLALLGFGLAMLAFGAARLGPGEWGLTLGLGALLWATLGPGR